ncbi:hypothetical protein GCM10008955_36290 [Deinococcus malanensis]|uniref:DUF2188 domain-containing protein n=1 Tax=Deinococcus malanensis TaxID=1706855 RepID=A0ABQ2F4B0_9DEIO|nr:hypothetical protein GCM10008955_36290 [Deinococcus malanensis]
MAFYATDPLAGGKAQSTIKLSDPRTTAQQQAITQAAANAKYALVTRDGETRIINLSVRSAHVH